MFFIQSIDEKILLLFQSAHISFLDEFFWYVSEAWVFLPLWLWALIKIFKTYSRTDVFKVILAVIITIFLSDQISNIFKNYFKRLRPTHNIELKDKIKVVNNYYGGKYGFYSAHASNSVAITCLALILIKNNKNKYWLLIYPFLSGISRMYLGVHYFSDVLAGWMMGSLIAILVYWMFYKYGGLNRN